MKAPDGSDNFEVAGLGGGGGFTKNAASRFIYLDANTSVYLKDFMGSDWSTKFGYPDSMDMSQPGGGGGGGGGGAGSDYGRYVESGSAGASPMGSFHCIITGSDYGSVVTPASGGAGGVGGSVVNGDGSGSVGGSGGGGGGSGGIIFIGARKVRISSTSYLIANGGNGGNGAQGFFGEAIGSNGGGGGGAGGGAGGILIIFTTTSSASAGWDPSDTARFNTTFGNKGLGAASLTLAGSGFDGEDGPNGGTFYIQI